jgi:long-chain fatty acid transport protein
MVFRYKIRRDKMKNILIKTIALSVVAGATLMAGGYKIPEVSTNGIALSAANIAHAHSADAAYYNPANMVFMKDEQSVEADMIYIGLDPVNFKGSGTMAGVDIDAKSESFFIPSLNYVSAKAGNARIGVSIVVPGGLSKRWSDSPAVDKAKEFTLSVTEINPTFAIPINDKLAVAFGFRILYSKGIVENSSIASRELNGDSVDFGYNLALAYKPTDSLEFGATYRSNVSLTEKGDAKLYIANAKVYDGGASVSVPLPAFLSLAAAYTFDTKTTLEFVYERNFWSAYKTLNFDYNSNIPAVLVPSMDMPIEKKWEDTNAFRLGITQEFDQITAMAGIVYDETPISDSKVSFELPDSNSISVSLGGRYQIDKKWNIGLSTLYSMREKRDVTNSELSGEFSNSNVLIVSAGVGYKF